MKKNATKTVFEKLNENNFKVVNNNETMNVSGGFHSPTFKKRAVATHHGLSVDVEFKVSAD